MAAGQFQVGDVVRVLSGRPSGTLKVITARDAWRKDPLTGAPISGQILQLRHVQPAILPDGQVDLWPGRPEIVGGHWIDVHDDELALVAAAGTTPL